MLEVFPRYGFSAESLNLIASTWVTRGYRKKKAYLQGVVKVMWNVEAQDFNGDLSALELALIN